MWVVMSAAEREQFLAGVHVGVLSVAAGAAGRTLAVPVWYSYRPGALVTVLTGRRSRKAAAIRAAGRFNLCVKDDSPPYRYVSVEGPVITEQELDPAERLAMARRYLGAAGGDCRFESVRVTRHALGAGCRVLLAVPQHPLPTR